MRPENGQARSNEPKQVAGTVTRHLDGTAISAMIEVERSSVVKYCSLLNQFVTSGG